MQSIHSISGEEEIFHKKEIFQEEPLFHSNSKNESLLVQSNLSTNLVMFKLPTYE